MKTSYSSIYRILFILMIFIFHSMSLMGDSDDNLLTNGGFEDKNLKGWEKDVWNEGGLIELSKNYVHDGAYSLKISSGDMENDIRVSQEVKVLPGTFYRLSAWIATENVQANKVGANICIMTGFDYEGNVSGTKNWGYYELNFKTSKKHYYIKVAARLGMYYNTVRGTAYFDNLKLEKLDFTPKYCVILKEPEGAETKQDTKQDTKQNNKKEEEVKKITRQDPVFSGINVPLILLLIFIGLGIVCVNVYLTIRREKKNAHDE
ncbi:MAG: carbohydrate binding domain-containing protein [Spirochaetales bacterium]|nr:carbohydrate binding domain-containing protein [Spirochaetales bacterium]